MATRNQTDIPLDWGQLEYFHALAGAVTLADAARRMGVTACEAMRSAAQRARDGLHPARGLTGTLRLSCPAWLADGLIVPALAAELQSHPALRDEVLATDGHVDLQSAGIDSPCAWAGCAMVTSWRASWCLALKSCAPHRPLCKHTAGR